MEKVLLLLTGCVNPNCNDVLAISDVYTRKEMYVKSINWYLENTPYRIVFCENSGTDISNEILVPQCNRVEFLTYISPADNLDRSKGYKEMEILEYINNHSSFLKSASFLVKITGRLILLNIIEQVSYFSCRNYESGFVSTFWNGRNHWADCRFIFFTKNFLNILISYKEKITSNYYFENITTDSIIDAKKKGISYYYPLKVYRVDGIGGGFGIDYNMSDWQYFWNNIKNLKRWLLFIIGYLPKYNC